MATISFNQIGAFEGIDGESSVLANPTSLQFGPDGRLYVTEQDGTINAFTVVIQNGQYIATNHEVLTLPGGAGVVKSIQNHNDNGSLSSLENRQVTGIVVTGTAENPVLYITSSDPRIASNGEVNLDTNSGVITRVTWNGTAWEAVDIVRGLPRSEENHSNNGMVLSPDGTKLYVAVGGNTNNGAPSKFFSYTGEYALSGTVLEVDLLDIASRPVLTDPLTGRNYIYDLPTLDDPTIPNDGVREDSNGLDVAGPWGGNDGFNMAILPADAPLRIYADGFRNNFDLVLTADGQLYTVDNGSNANLGGSPIIGPDGQATNQPNDGGDGDPEPLFLIMEGGYYGHPAPARSNQDLAWTVYGDDGNPDPSLNPNSVANLSDLVPDGVIIQQGFVIDPSKFTGDPDRLLQSGTRIPFDSNTSPALVTIGSSSNGLVEYTGNAFGGALQGALFVAQFNGNVTLLNVNADGTGLEPLIGPGNDGVLGTGDDEVIDTDGVVSNLISGLATPLDVTMGPDGTLWVAEIGGDFVKVFAPSDLVLPDDPDFDNDGIFNVDDPFMRDATNGGSVVVLPGQTLLWDFDPNQDNNLPGPEGYATGLTGVMVNGVTDFEQFFQEPSDIPGQVVKLDNMKFATAAGGGATVIENVSNGDPLAGSNSGEFLFHTGATISPTVETFTIKWCLFNPGVDLTGLSQQIGGYIGTGDQSNYLKIVATPDPGNEIQIVLENGDAIQAQSSIQADGLLSVPDTLQKIFFELEIDPTAATATPSVTYETGGGNTSTATGTAIDLSGTAVLDAIRGDYTVQGKTTGLAVGLLASNNGQDPADTFQAVFDEIEITATGDTSQTVLYRVNAGGALVAASDGGPDWSADTQSSNSIYLANPGSNNTAGFSAVEPGTTVPASVPGIIFDTERWDNGNAPEMQWAFDVPTAGLYEVRLYMGNGYGGTNDPGERVFDVAVEGSVPAGFDNIDLSGQFSHQVGGLLSEVVEVTDGTLNLEFLHGVENPLINGIEIVQLGGQVPPTSPTVSIVGGPYIVAEDEGQVQISFQTDVPVPSGEAIDVSFQIVPDTPPGEVIPGEDYDYPGADFFLPETGIYTGTATIAAGSSEATISIDILEDTLQEPDEAFTVNITGVSPNTQIGTGSTSVTILDNDTNEVSIATNQDAAEPDINGQFTVSLTQMATSDTVVSYTVEGTATPDDDYTALTGTVTIAAGELSAAIDLTVLDDLLDEGAEDVVVTLDSITAGDSNLVISGTDRATLTINDDDAVETVLYRVNAGGALVAASDGGPDWSADTQSSNSIYLANPGSNTTSTFSAVEPGTTVPASVPGIIFDTERWDNGNAPEMQWAFDVPTAGLYEVRLYMGNGYGGTNDPGERVFDVAVEGSVPAGFDNIDLSGQFGHQVGGLLSEVVEVTDGTLNLEFLHGVENPLINGIEIVQLGTGTPLPPEVSIVGGPYTVAEDEGQVQISLVTDVVVPSDETVDVTFEVVPGTATPQQDYDLPTASYDEQTGIYTGTVTIAGSSARATFLIDILEDTLQEPDEAFTVNITGVSPNAQIGTGSTSVTILDNDTNEVSIATNQDAAEPDINGQFTVSLTQMATSDTVVSYTVEGTATPDDDYTALTGTVTIAAGDVSAPIDVTVLDDLLEEGAESVIVTLDNITAGDSTVVLGATNSATLTINDDDAVETVLYRVNAGGALVAASDGGPDWSADTTANNSPYLSVAGSNNTSSFAAVNPGATVPETVPGIIFDTERWDNGNAPEMQWAFDVPTAGLYEVRLYMGNGFSGTNDPGERVFDVAVEGSVPAGFDNIDLSGQFGHQVGGLLSEVVEVTDGTLNLEFLHGVENPLINGIEIVQLGGQVPPTSPTVSILNPDTSVGEGDGQVQISLATDFTVPNDETVTVTFEITPGTATPQADYEYLSPTATFDAQTGVYTDTVTIAGGSSDATFLVNLLQDTDQEPNEAFTVNITEVSPNAQIGTNSATVTILDDDQPSGTNGAAVLSINLTSNDVQVSNFGNNSFQLTNVGDKTIAQVEIDVTNALYPDTVFDPEGVAGDTVSKALQINNNGSTGVVLPSTYNPYVGAGGIAGYEGLILLFDEAVNGGFEGGETVGFSIDMDPNSIAGATKSTLDGGSNPAWDVGGVSGAELIGSTFTVTFTDGTTATGQLHGAGNQAGSKGLATQDSPNLPVTLTVNDLGAGGVGTYSAGGPTVSVNGLAGQTTRVVLTKGFIQPVNNNFSEPYASQLDAQLAALAAQDFPANNAVEFQTVDIDLTGADQDISSLFDFSGVPIYDFVGEDQLALGFVASVIDPTNNVLPIGPVTQPIYLQFDDQILTQLLSSPSVIVSEKARVEMSELLNDGVNLTSTPGNDWPGTSGVADDPVVIDKIDVGDVLETEPIEVGQIAPIQMALLTDIIGDSENPNGVASVLASEEEINLTIQKIEDIERFEDDPLTGLTWDGEQWVGDGIGTTDYAADTAFGAQLMMSGEIIYGVSGEPFVFSESGWYRITLEIEEGASIALDEETIAYNVAGDQVLGIVSDSDTHNGLITYDILVSPSTLGSEVAPELVSTTDEMLRLR